MDRKMEELITLSGGSGKYQIILLILTFFIWIIFPVHSTSLPMLEKVPVVTYNIEGGKEITDSLTYEICEKGNYTINETFGYSWVIDMDIYCDKNKVGLIGSFTYAGFTLGAFCFSLLDKFISPKFIIIWAIVFYSTFLCLSTFISNFYFRIVILLLLGIGNELGLFTGMKILSESVSSKNRAFFTSIVNIGYCFSSFLFTPLLVFFNNWKYVFWLHNIIAFILLIFFFIIVVNSPRYYLSNNRFEKVKESLKKIAIFNGKGKEDLDKIEDSNLNIGLSKVSGKKGESEENKEKKENKENKENKETKESDENTKNIENKKSEESKGNEENTENQETKFNAENKESIEKKGTEETEEKEEEKFLENDKPILSYSALIKYASIRYIFLIFTYMWISATFLRNSVAINTKIMEGDTSLIVVLLYCGEMISCLVSGFIINWPPLGRKKSLILFYFGMGLGFVLYLVFTNFGFSPISKFLAMLLIRFSIAAAENTFYTYCLESYPTAIRALAFGIHSGSGSLAGIVSPMIIEHVDSNFLYTIYAIICGIACFLAFFLKETVGQPMKETVDELIGPIIESNDNLESESINLVSEGDKIEKTEEKTDRKEYDEKENNLKENFDSSKMEKIDKPLLVNNDNENQQ